MDSHTPAHNLALHRFALLVAGATLFLLAAGASVTSTGSGLAVPDWPLSFGGFFPAMEGGVFYEHGHRMVAGVVLVLTTILVIWLFRREERAWVRRVGLVALIALLLQAVLGGVTVLLKLPAAVSVGHAALAQAFFCLIVSIGLFTSPGWQRSENHPESDGSLRRLAVVTTGVIYAQILLGAIMRHTGAGLAIPDFPLAYGQVFPPYLSQQPVLIHFAHRLGAVAVSVCVVILFIRIVSNHRDDARFMLPALVLAGLTVFQIFLGALTIWMRKAVLPTTTHVAIGATILAVSLVIALRSYRFLASRYSESTIGFPETTGAYASEDV